MKILISCDARYPWGFTAYYCTSITGWASVSSEMFKKMEYIFYNNRSFFAETLFKEYPGCDEIIVCEEGDISIYHIDDKNKPYMLEL